MKLQCKQAVRVVINLSFLSLRIERCFCLLTSYYLCIVKSFRNPLFLFSATGEVIVILLLIVSFQYVVMYYQHYDTLKNCVNKLSFYTSAWQPHTGRPRHTHTHQERVCVCVWHCWSVVWRDGQISSSYQVVQSVISLIHSYIL